MVNAILFVDSDTDIFGVVNEVWGGEGGGIPDLGTNSNYIQTSTRLYHKGEG